jgi:DNA replication and repair protein RecF
MPQIKRLQINNLRNIEHLSLEGFSPSANLFYGENGSGKTSLLEAISLLGLGRSFRSHKISSLIKHNQQQLTVFAELETNGSVQSLGLQKNKQDKSTLIRINGETAPSAASLAQLLPLQIINADSFQLVEGTPLQRRRFLDWMVFHVKHDFIVLWRNVQRVTKQRNSMLKHDKISRSQLESWNSEFIKLSEAIHGLRQSVFDAFLENFSQFHEAFPSLRGSEISITYNPGWNLDEGLAQVLESDFERDSRDGFTHHGPHRADIRFRILGKPVADVLSRGQEKVLICALYIAQTQLHKQFTERSSVFLIDDLLAELDITNARYLVEQLIHLDAQFFVTGIDKENLLSAWSIDKEQNHAVFHVKHGDITTEITD